MADIAKTRSRGLGTELAALDMTVADVIAAGHEYKVVQRELFDLWTEHPELAPTERPDLATEVRPELDRITVAFIDQLVGTVELRSSPLRCKALLNIAKMKANHQYGLDRLHRRALRGAIQPVCA
ncbi:hypothetical protein GCM10010191_46080 [Actinomadura vinacea]|uniref:Uncharacterized protein n=1 Tax=Actinomadura vinacea TaxID=115336 RepID=A0ABN3JGU7_9ACTN